MISNGVHIQDNHPSIPTPKLIHRSINNLRNGLNSLGVVEQLLRVVLGLELLQLTQVLAVVELLSRGAREAGIGVVDVGAPAALGKRRGSGIDPAVEEGEGAVGVDLFIFVAVVELDEIELVAVGVGGLVVGDLRNLRVLATMRIELEEPEAVDDVVGHVEPVVDKSLGRLAAQALNSQALSVEILLLVESEHLQQWNGMGDLREKDGSNQCCRSWSS